MKKTVIFLLLMFLVFSCREKVSIEEPNTFTTLDKSSCVGCHTDKELLAAVTPARAEAAPLLS